MAVELKDQLSSEQQYLGHTAIVETRPQAADGSAICILNFCPRFWLYSRIFRPDLVVRIVEPLAGQPAVRVWMRPLVGRGAREPRRITGSNHVTDRGHELSFRLPTDAPVTAVMEEPALIVRSRLTFVLGADEPVDLLGQRVRDDDRGMAPRQTSASRRMPNGTPSRIGCRCSQSCSPEASPWAVRRGALP